MRRSLLTASLALALNQLSGQAGTNDPTFNPTDIGFGFGDGASHPVNACATQPDGKILIGGSFTSYNGTARNYIARLNEDGSLDAGFDPGTGAQFDVASVALQPDGKCLVVGCFISFNGLPRKGIVRLNNDGSLDTGFNIGSGPNGCVLTVAIQSDGKMVIGGAFTTYDGIGRNHIARLNSDGSLDTSFDPGTGADIDVKSVVIQGDGKVLIGGPFTSYNGSGRNRIARLNANGSLDATFDPGTGANGSINTIAIQSDGKVFIGGSFTSYNGTGRNRIARLNSNGGLDTSFNPGSGANATLTSVAIQPDGKVLVGGSFTICNGVSRVGIARLLSNGSSDVSFDLGSGTNTGVNSVTLRPDGKIVIGGIFTSYNGTGRNRVAQLNANGSLDIGFYPGTGANAPINSLTLQSDGKVVIGGSFTTYNGTGRNCIARLNADGSLDTGFDPGTGANGTVNTIAIQSDGKVIIGGAFSTYNGTARIRIARLNADGSLDTSFDPGAGPSFTVHAIAVRTDGKIVLGGDFFSYDGTTRNNIARLNANGSLDTAFDPGTGTNFLVNDIELQADGKVIIGGGFTTFNGTARNRIARLNADGSLDTGFEPGTGTNGSVLAIALQSDGKIIIGGGFTTYNGAARNRIARLNVDGGIDTGFNPGPGANSTIYSTALQPDGRVVLGGDFTTYNSIGCQRIARINTNGTFDTGFNSGTGSSVRINALAVRADGKILVGGEFTAYNGTGRNRIARIFGCTPGSVCDDGNGCTTGDTVDANCTCSGTFQDADSDGICDANDGCPADPNKIAPGICNCGVSDADGDGDGTADCNDGCPSDPNKTAPGICNCGVSDTDSDGDGTANCNDGCPNDANKIALGVCGCGVADTDTDGDGTADCNDGCPTDPNKIAPGICGCGVSDADNDGDGTVNCNDGCPNDASKTSPGICSCGVSDADSDGDGTADCNDGCPNDANKLAPGACGCGVADIPTTWFADGDGDGFGNALSSQPGLTCSQPSGYVASNTDCNDADPSIHPGAADIDDSIDNDCDGFTDVSLGDYRTRAGGSWASTTVWQRFDGTDWVDVSTSPTSSDGRITIRNPHSVITNTVTADQVLVEPGASLIVDFPNTFIIAEGPGTDMRVRGTFRMNPGSLFASSGTSEVESGGGFTWSGGQLNGNLHLLSGSTGSMPDDNGHILNGTLQNGGAFTWAAGTIGGSGNIQNDQGGVFNIQVSGTSLSTRPFINSGQLSYTGTGIYLSHPGNTFTNTSTGSFQVNDGSFRLLSTLTNAGNMHVAAGRSLHIYSTATLNPGTTITGTGTIYLEAEVFQNFPWTLSTHTLTLGGGWWRNTGGNALVVAPGGTFTWQNGMLGDGGPITIQSGATATLPGNNDRTLRTALTNNGTVSWTGGSLSGTGSWTNGAGGVLNITHSGAQLINTTVVNGGTINYSGSSTFSTFPSASFTNATGGLLNVNAGSWTFEGASTQNGTLNVASGASLNFNVTTTIAGPVTNAGTFTGGIGAFTGSSFTNNGSVPTNLPFTGSSAQGLSGTGNINTLTINNANGVTLGGTQTINTSLALTNGNVTMGANSLLLGTSATLTGGSASSYCVTDGTGVLRRRVVNNATDVLFPVGRATSYLPASVQLTVGSTADDFSVRVQGALSDEYDGSGAPTGGALTQRVVTRTWNINEAISGGSNASVQLQWNAGDEGASFNRASCSVMRYDGTDWVTSAFGASGGSGPYTRSLSGITAFSPFSVADDLAPLTSGITAAVKVFLDGPYNTTTGLMDDGVRASGLVPTAEPYTAMGYGHVGGGGETTTSGVLSTTGNNAIVDWVVLELRDVTTPSTVLATRSALLQRDGDVVHTDGTSPVPFTQPAGNYHLAVRHRNHLGCATGSAVALSSSSAVVDFTNVSTGTYGTNARKTSGGAVSVQLLWAGDVSFDHTLKYTGASNDRDPILVTVGSTTPNNVVSLYSTRDVNLNGQVKYTGSGNDRDPILVNVGSTTPNNIRVEQLP